MNRDATIVQAAILLIIIAIVGVAILKQQSQQDENDAPTIPVVAIQEAQVSSGSATSWTDSIPSAIVDKIVDTSVEQLNSPHANLVKKYFAHIAKKDYVWACDIIAGGKCNASRPESVANFSREFGKLTNGYEYVNVKDYGTIAPSGKHVVCVKYSYRYNEDPNPGLVSEVLSFYTDSVGGTLKVTDRVCEKKYKEWRGLRDCPILAAAEFCEGKVK